VGRPEEAFPMTEDTDKVQTEDELADKYVILRRK
jgi:hypothetical protein